MKVCKHCDQLHHDNQPECVTCGKANFNTCDPEEVEPARQRPFLLERYTMHNATLAILALLWTLLAFVVTLRQFDVDQVWLITTSIMSFYFGRESSKKTK